MTLSGKADTDWPESGVPVACPLVRLWPKADPSQPASSESANCGTPAACEAGRRVRRRAPACLASSAIAANVGAGVSGLLYVFTRPSVKDCRKSFGRDFPRFRSFPQFGGEFYHFAVGQTANERCELVDLLCLYGRFP